MMAVLTAGCGRKMEVFRGRLIEKSELSTPKDASPLPSEFLSTCGSPTNPQLAAGFSHYQRQQYDSCRVSLEDVLGQYPSEWRAHYLLGLLDYQGQDFGQAERNLLAALRFVPLQTQCRAPVYLALGMTLEQKGEYARSKQHFLTALNLDSTSVEAKNGLDRLTSLTSVEP